MTALILDAEALSLLARGGPQEHTVRAALVAALAESADVVVPAAVLAELYRGGGHDQGVDACLAREGGIAVAPTDLTLARRIGHLLVAAGRGSADHVDAAVVAVCAAAGGGVVLTGDTTDLSVLAGGSPAITIRSIE
ncbi:MAG: PIN domain-containing protein [Actinomycetota bacterium]|nr:PIN domain-containing protein [Actinomycetota bacterium]